MDAEFEETVITARYARLLAACLDITPNVEEALAAADVAFAMEPEINGSFAHDIANRKAQGLLNRAMEAAQKLSKAAKDELKRILESDPSPAVLERIETFLQKYRTQIANLLTTTQIAVFLEGMREVAKSIRNVPVFPASALPPTLTHARASDMVERLAILPEMDRELAIYALPAAEQQFIRDLIIAEGQRGEPSSFVPQPPEHVEGESFVAEDPGDIHLVFIDEAAKQLEAKNVVDKTRFSQLDAAARQKAFTIAGVDSQETMTKVRDALAETVREGPDFKVFTDKVLEKVDAGTFLSDSHRETVFRTVTQSALSDGKMAVLQHPFVKSGFPYVRYDAIHDDRVRANHLAMETLGIGGKNVYRIDDPVFQTFRPSWDWACRCGWAPLTINQAAELGCWEALKWRTDGVEPTPPAFVSWPDFRPDPAFQRSLGDQPIVVQLSLMPVASFAHDEANFFQVKPEQRSFYQEGMNQQTGKWVQPIPEPKAEPLYVPNKENPRLKKEPNDSGRWITIGSKEGADGKKHGGSPVFIKNGRIEKGHPGLVGKRIDALKESAEDKRPAPLKHDANRKERKEHAKKLRAVQQSERQKSRYYERAVWAKKARKEKLDPASLHQLAAEFIEHDRHFKEDILKVQKDARQRAMHYGEKLGGKAFKDMVAEGRFDADAIPHFDEIATSIQTEHPHLFIGYPEPDERLAEIMEAGEPERISEDAAYQHAFDVLYQHKQDSRTREDSDIPFAISFEETKHPRGQPENKGQFAKKPQSTNESAGGETSVVKHDNTAFKEAQKDYLENGVRSVAFKKWFGDWENDPENASKIVDKDGKPQQTLPTDGKGKPVAVFHGTPHNFDAFQTEKAGTNTDAGFLGTGLYFTDRKDVAEYYAKKSGTGQPAVIAAFLSVKNPFYWGTKTLGSRGLVLRGDMLPQEIHERVLARTGFKYDPEAEPDFNDEKLIAQAIREELIALGYDGVIADTDKSREFVAFQPNQIKAVDNFGTFDSESDNIRFSNG